MRKGGRETEIYPGRLKKSEKERENVRKSETERENVRKSETESRMKRKEEKRTENRLRTSPKQIHYAIRNRRCRRKWRRIHKLRLLVN